MWGGFTIRRSASEDQGKPVYVGCEFEGALKTSAEGAQSTVSEDGTEIHFRINEKNLKFEDGTDDKICSGYESLPDEKFARGR